MTALEDVRLAFSLAGAFLAADFFCPAGWADFAADFFFSPLLERKKDFFAADFLGPSLPAGCERPVSFFSCSDI
ncbi:hypothetical protein [Intestinimonas butyriciproducens]|uniref:hypothetical protein n=1 Tax=Intestinimonas butyriciproducens TaxID=1297617 RepID=UPI001FAF3598|nr:hypothetical protein [Intestinimonas butyriciproducens]